MIVGSAFQRGFSRALNIKAWEKVGAVPLSRKCLSSPKVRRSIGNGDDDQQALVHLIVLCVVVGRVQWGRDEGHVETH